MRFDDYKDRAAMRYAEKTIQDRKSFLRLFDVYLRGIHSSDLTVEEAIERYQCAPQPERVEYQLSDYEPEELEQIREFILHLYNELDYSRVMARHNFDAIQSYCYELGLDVYDEREFKQFRDRYLSGPEHNPEFGLRAEERNVFTLDEVGTIIEEARDPFSDFFAIQYLHCRRPGEVSQLEVSDFNFDVDPPEVWYSILKQKYGEDNRRRVLLRNQHESAFLRNLVLGRRGTLFHMELEEVRKELRRVQEEHDIINLQLKDLRHSRVSHLKAAGWENIEIRDRYTKHKNLSTLGHV